MLNFSPTNGEGSSDSPDVIMESASEDDDIDISQFVESVLEEPEEPSPPRSMPPPMVFFPNQNARKSHQAFRGGIQLPSLSPFPSQTIRPGQAVTSGLRPVQTRQYAVPPLRHIYPGKALVNHHLPNNAIPSISWLTDSFDKVRKSCDTLGFQVKTFGEKLKNISSTSDTKRIMSLSNELQSLLRQTELGYKYLGTNLSSDHQKWALQTSQRRIASNMTSNGTQNVMVKRQILLPLSSENKTLNLRPNERLTLPPNMLISVNGSNHSLSITTMDKELSEKQITELCAKYNIKPCHVLLERCDQDNTDNDDIEIIEELIAL